MEITIIPKLKRYEPLINLYPPQPANKFLPEWYKKQKYSTHLDSWKYFHGHKNSKVMGAKNCPAIQDYITSGFIIPAWTDIFFTTALDDEGKVVQYYDASIRRAYDDPINIHIDDHPIEQTEGMDIGRLVDNRILKLQMPYWFKIPEGYNVMYQDPFYHFRQDIRCLTGIVEADKWGYVAFPFEVLSTEFRIEAGTPLIHVFLYKREDYNLKLDVRNGTEEEYAEIQTNLKKLHISNKTYRTVKDDTFYK